VATLLAGFAALAFELGILSHAVGDPNCAADQGADELDGHVLQRTSVFLLLKFRKIHADDWAAASRNLGIASLIAVVIAHSTLAWCSA
jgi:hypothetical protein